MLGNVSSLGFGALVSPGREIAHIIYRDPHRCQNLWSLFEELVLQDFARLWIVAMYDLQELNGSKGECIASSRGNLQHCAELSFLANDYIQTGNKHLGYIPAPDTSLISIFLVIDECLDEAHLQHLQESLHAFVDSLPLSTRVGIISYGRTVSVYDFSEGSTASADVLPGDTSPTQESLKALIYGTTGIYLSPIHVCLLVAHAIFSSLRPYRLKLPEVLRDRCLGAAMEVALATIQGPSAEMSCSIVKRSRGSCRILVCAGGPNTYGPGAVLHSFNHHNYPYMEKTAMKWMEHLGNETRRHDTVVDVLYNGHCPGAELSAQEGKSTDALAACRTLAEELTEQRFPAPRILVFKEGSSQAWYFVSRLIPAHKDPPYEQEARFPQLRSLSTEQKGQAEEQFHSL